MDPIEPNIDPVLTASTNALGMAMAWRMIAEGKTGIATNASYDQWSPARQYSLNHRGARILTETASARLASPVDMPFAQLGTGRGYDARVATWNYPAVWPGGRWGIGDIVAYQVERDVGVAGRSGARSAELARELRGAGRSRDGGRPSRGPRPSVPTAYVIPKAQQDPQALQRLLWTLQHGQVEVYDSDAATAATWCRRRSRSVRTRRRCWSARQYPNLQRVSRRSAQATRTT